MSGADWSETARPSSASAGERALAPRDRDGYLLGFPGGLAWRARITGEPLYDEMARVALAGVRELGVIRKRFSGLLREALTDADSFGLELAEGSVEDLATRKMLLGATFLIDVKYFERRRN